MCVFSSLQDQIIVVLCNQKIKIIVVLSTIGDMPTWKFVAEPMKKQ